MDLYTSAMKLCMGEMSEGVFRERATVALTRLARRGDRDWMKLHFKHLTREEIDGFGPGSVSAQEVDSLVSALIAL
jgi:hypothetical protein